VNENLLLTFGYSHVEVTNISTQEDGYRFSFLGAEDLPLIPPELQFGGQIISFVDARPSDARRAGMPEDIVSFTGTYDFNNGLAVNASVIIVEETYSGFSNSVELPDYTLVNLGVSYETQDWLFSVSGKNLTDEEYFRSNFPNLFGGTIVLPELPRHYVARMQYKF
jgi:iron complex outermembrane receptor protein